MEDPWKSALSDRNVITSVHMSTNGNVNLPNPDNLRPTENGTFTSSTGSSVPRSRANTWPLNQEEKEDQDGDHDPCTLPTLQEEEHSGESSSAENLSGPSSNNVQNNAATVLLNSKNKKNSARRNPWGNMSYADLIEKAIDNAPDKRLTLSQIYDWLVQNVPYFKEKADSNSSAGWKNSVRHNLSLHNRFMRVQNETGTGKSSWWMVNQSAKFDKPSRRRAATMEPKEYEKRKGRLKKGIIHGVDGDFERNVSPISPVVDSASPYQHLAVSDFRSRTGSSASSYGCLSPKSPALEDHPSPTLSPRSWSTSGYDSTGSAGRMGSEFGFNYEQDFANQLAKNISLSEAARHPSFEPTNKAFLSGTANQSTTYHQGASGGFLPPPYTAHTLPFYGNKFAPIPEEPRMSNTHTAAAFLSRPPPAHHHHHHPTNSGGVTLSSSSGISGGYATFTHQPNYPTWSLPHDLESFSEPVQSFSDFDWEELLQHDVAMERQLHGVNAAPAPSVATSHANGVVHVKPFVNGDLK